MAGITFQPRTGTDSSVVSKLVSKDPLSMAVRALDQQKGNRILEELLGLAQAGRDIDAGPVKSLFSQYLKLFPEQASFIEEYYRSSLPKDTSSYTWHA
jgi:hypothetical protein